MISVEYVEPRKAVSDGYLDEYRVNLLKSSSDSKGRPLWAVYFHLGHVKLWSQRKMGYKVQ
ncbi:hypothetical protein ACIQSO_24865 [Pseudomonas putida]|uniref:hypothetical protein n=1 Tax=Pseudomonas putida TaxID=303 RepID=UPI00383B8274